MPPPIDNFRRLALTGIATQIGKRFREEDALTEQELAVVFATLLQSTIRVSRTTPDPLPHAEGLNEMMCFVMAALTNQQTVEPLFVNYLSNKFEKAVLCLRPELEALRQPKQSAV